MLSAPEGHSDTLSRMRAQSMHRTAAQQCVAPQVFPGNPDRLLARFARTHDKDLRDRVVQSHTGLVRRFASRYAHYGEIQEDLFRAGMIGLIKAVDHFDPDRHLQFSTYAVPCIVGEIKRYLRDKSWSLKIPRHLRELYLKAISAKETLSIKLGREPSLRELSANLDIAEEDLRKAVNLDLVRYTVSFSTTVTPAIESTTHLNINQMLGAEDQQILNMPTHIDLSRALERLEPRLKNVVLGIYFDQLSQAELGLSLHLSQMQISRLHKRALQTLRDELDEEYVL